jgi:uncharacterized protein (TIGR03067 family)
MKLLRFAVILSLFVLATAARGEDVAAKGDLQGTWTCTSGVIDGKPLAEETAKRLRLTLTADRYKTERGDEVLFDSTYTIDAAKNPKQIDMIGTEGELKGRPALGIYRLEGDMLTICYVMPGGQRPAAFESKPQSGVYVVVWKREEKK